MEEWHQKLHNNTSPDDVVICQALIAMLEEGLDVRSYWRTLNVRCKDTTSTFHTASAFQLQIGIKYLIPKPASLGMQHYLDP